MTRDEGFVEQLKRDYTTASLDGRARAILDYAAKLTRTPADMNESDIERLRGAGLSDAAILDLNLMAGYYGFINRVAEGLGVELESFWEVQQSRNAGR